MTPRPDLGTLDHSPRLDVSMLLTGEAQEAGPVTVRPVLYPDQVKLDWTRPGGGLSGQRLALVCYSLPFGGAKVLIACTCGARVRSVFLNASFDTWGCRACLRLRYASQRVHYPAKVEG